MSFNLLTIGSQAVQANQTALSTVGQNISNVNTEGYSRQRVDLVSRPNFSGVYVNNVERIADQFLTQQLWSDQSSYSMTSTYADMSGQLDNLLAAQTTSVSAALDDYFSALQNVVDDPVSIPNRELFIAQSDALVKRFNSLDTNLRRQEEMVNTQIDGLASQVTTLASNIAGLNEKIKIADTANKPSNDLRDQRDVLTNQLSEIVAVRVLEPNTSEYSIFIGNGQPLVVGAKANEMVAVQGNPDSTQKELSLLIAGNLADVNDELSGGKIGGLLQYRDQGLSEARDELGRIAIAFADSMNEQHKSGLNLNNELGGALFSEVNADAKQFKRIVANANNSAMPAPGNPPRVEIQDVSQLKATDYSLVYGGTNQITLIRNSDGKQTSIQQLTPAVDAASVTQQQYYLDPTGKQLSFAVDGFKVTIDTSTALARGDGFLIQPVRGGADDLSLVIQDGRELALASPIRIKPDSDNQGNGVASAKVTDPSVVVINNNQLVPPVDIVFNNTTPDMTYSVYDMSEPTNPQVLSSNQTYVPGTAIQLTGYAVTIDNQPRPGDRFSFEFNKDGVSDNRNALAISDLQKTDLLPDGDYQDLYGSLLERVGSRTATARISAEANQAVLKTTVGAKAGVSGVNLDEEAAKLVQYQQAYQASAQLIRVSQTLFDSLLSSI